MPGQGERADGGWGGDATCFVTIIWVARKLYIVSSTPSGLRHGGKKKLWEKNEAGKGQLSAVGRGD